MSHSNRPELITRLVGLEQATEALLVAARSLDANALLQATANRADAAFDLSVVLDEGRELDAAQRREAAAAARRIQRLEERIHRISKVVIDGLSRAHPAPTTTYGRHGRLQAR